MQEFGDFAKIDIDKLLKGMDDQLGRLGEFQKRAGECVGRAEDENGFVSVEYGQNGVQELTLHPKAMRLSSGELAELIKATLADATSDYQRAFGELMTEVFGEAGNPLTSSRAALEDLERVEKIHDRAFHDVMGELDRIRRRLQL
ncbi:YbaB/EbfC family DNA-binding protein [Actinomadura sp. ATCC 31491]|uniref:YbaB/EbfC family DNA-binding protein n=1 Tax=Actinomadura luzonensis TaxID=2805427 RepID=A0ABT0GAP7_9ACTN|nr:YbaB/EbfC family DNA-binding protein [Actinomadura luzonensis]MCK2221295.1 YbaB/EbfC family DNA-binding protein [Actinomadura luzonensis]